MPSNGIFEFYPSFKEFLPVYRDVTRIWMGDGESTGESGMLYAEYADGHVQELGWVSMYGLAVQEAGYTGTPEQWVQFIVGVANLIKGSVAEISYKVSDSGTEHPNPEAEWSPTPVFEKGKFTWAKFRLTWVDGNISTFYMASYQGKDGDVKSVNGEKGDIILHGENLRIGESYLQSIKDYVDEQDMLTTATEVQIDALFHMAYFSGAAFITGRHFIPGDEIRYKIESLTENAPMPEDTEVIIHPDNGKSYNFHFGHIMYKMEDIPDGQSSATFEYRISEVSHNMDGVPGSTIHHDVTITITDAGDGSVIVSKSENFNKLYFVYEYTADGSITFEGTIKLNGRTMAAREFMVQIIEHKESGDEIIANNLSTTVSAATGQPAAIAFPPINYMIEDVGTHIYYVKETSLSGEGVTIDEHIYTVTVDVTDTVRDAELEIDAHGTDKNLDFTNIYQATGTATFYGTKTLTYRLFRATDEYHVQIAGSGRLPIPNNVNVPLTVGSDHADFEFATVTYDLTDMANSMGGYDDTKTLVYNVSEIQTALPGVEPDGRVHTITVQLLDNKRGSIIVTVVYSDVNGVQFTGLYKASGSYTIIGEKRLINRRFKNHDHVYMSISTSNEGKLPVVTTMEIPQAVNQYIEPFNFLPITYVLADLKGEPSQVFSYLVTETATIDGSSPDGLTHTVDILVEDLYNGQLGITPSYNDGNKLQFVSTYAATGSTFFKGTKHIRNRKFKGPDMMTVTVSAQDGGNLPAPVTIPVDMEAEQSDADFVFNKTEYQITDLGGLESYTWHYTITEDTQMAGTQPLSLTDSFSVLVEDDFHGNLVVTPTYSTPSGATLTNIYSASTYLSFKTRTVFTNGKLQRVPITTRITQVAGNNSQTQAVENVVLPSPVTRTANTNNNTEDLVFENIAQFVKNSNRDDTQNSYWFMIEQVLPIGIDGQGIYDDVQYDTSKKWINVAVKDNFDGTLQVLKTPAPEVSTNLDDTFINEQLADLTIVEVWTRDHERMTAAEKNQFTYTVSGPNSYETTFTYNEMVNNQKTLTKLHYGEYTLVQTNNEVENFNIGVAYTSDGPAPNKANVNRVEGRTITVTNEVNRLEATLKVQKVWAGEHDWLTQNQKNSVTFTVTGPKQKSTDANTYSRTFTYADMTNNLFTIERLTLGTYTVVETGHTFTDNDDTVVYTVSGAETNSVILADADNKTVVVTDTYVHHKGTIRVTASFNDIISKPQPAQFNITNTHYDYKNLVFTYANADNADVADGVTTPYEWTIKNVPVHTTVQFTQNDAEVLDHDLTTIVSPANRTCAAVTKNNISDVVFTNNYTLHRGTVKVTKVFNNITKAQQPANYAITNNYNDTVFTLNNADNKATADGTTIPYEWTITNVPVRLGNVYTAITFTEQNSSVTDYDLEASAVPANYTNNNLSKNSTQTVAMTNNYILHRGSVKVTKQFVNLPVNEKPGTFNITNTYSPSTQFTYANANNADTADGITVPYEWIIPAVPVHTEITFTENNYSVNDYDVAASAVPANYKSAEVTKNNTSTVDITNTYTQHKGSVKVKLSFSGIQTSEKPTGVKITNNYNNAEFTLENADNILIADGFSVPYEWTITNVPVREGNTRTQITFIQTSYNVTNYDMTTDVAKTSAQVVKNETAAVEFVNTYSRHLGSVRVSKLFVGLGDEPLPSTFRITNNYNSNVFTLGNAVNRAEADGKTVPYEWTIINIPTARTVTFTEANADTAPRYDLDPSVETIKTSGTITKNTETSVSFTNTYTRQKGWVKIAALFSTLPANRIPSSFVITNDYNAYVCSRSNISNASENPDGVTKAFEWIISDVPTETVITFTEYNLTAVGYDLGASVQTVKSCPAITKNAESNVSFVNNYVKQRGSVKVSKAFVGIDSTKIPMSTFNIKNSINDVILRIADSDNPSVAGDAAHPFEWTMNNIEVEQTITFTEYNANIDYYDRSGATSVTSGEISKTTVAEANFVNTYTRQRGDITITALFDGITSSELPENFEITNNYDTSTTFTYANASSGDGINTPYTWTLSNVEAGLTVTFTESNFNVTGKTMTTPFVQTSAPVTKNTPVTVNFVNTYEPEGT